jgi:hypothetical protein
VHLTLSRFRGNAEFSSTEYQVPIMIYDSTSIHHFIAMPLGLNAILHLGNMVSEPITETPQSNCNIGPNDHTAISQSFLGHLNPDFWLATSRISGLQAILDPEYRTSCG